MADIYFFSRVFRNGMLRFNGRWQNGYYLFDDVCISTDSTYCYETIDNVPCNVGLYDKSAPNEKVVIRITDLMGRDTENKPNTPLIYIYSDGTTERVFKME